MMWVSVSQEVIFPRAQMHLPILIICGINQNDKNREAHVLMLDHNVA